MSNPGLSLNDVRRDASQSEWGTTNQRREFVKVMRMSQSDTKIDNNGDKTWSSVSNSSLSKKCLVQKNFGSQKILYPKNLFWVLVLLVTWVIQTPYPLNSA